MKLSWKERGFNSWRDLADLPYPTVLTAVLTQIAPGEGHARGFLVFWARNADYARRAIRQHFGNYYAPKARIIRGAVFVEELEDLLPSRLQDQIRSQAAEVKPGAQLLEFAVFYIHQRLKQSA